MSAQTHVAWDEELKDNAMTTVLIVVDVKASKKGPPSPLWVYNLGMRVPRQYKYFMLELFGVQFGHLN